MAFKYLIASFFLENICHSQEQFSYEVFGHFSVADNVIDSCCKLVADTAVKTAIVFVGAEKVKYCKASELQNECLKYFERYYKFLAMDEPLILPSVIPTKFTKIFETMRRWCQTTQESDHVKGFVLHSFLIKDLYLKMYNDKLDGLRQKLNIEDFPSTPTITVFNPKEMIFFLIRIEENDDVETEIKLCGAELKILLLLLGDELKNTGIKVIPLVVTDKESKCTHCRKYLVLRQNIENFSSFMAWYEQKSVDFEITSADSFEKKKTNEIFAKVVFCMGATKISGIFPAFTTNGETLMKGALFLLTPEQLNILHSEEKHIILNGPYGSGKSIIGRTKAKMIAEQLPDNELLYYISNDLRSALLTEIERNNPKIKVYPDKEEQKRIKLSDMIKEILKINKMESQHKKNNKSEKKLNLIIDEYDGEKLDRREADALNDIINIEYKKTFQDAVILLIAQSMKKERRANDNLSDSNRFDLLENMKRKTLKIVMRNSMQIHNLLEVTKEFLENVTTRYELQGKKKENLQQENNENQTKQEKDRNKNKESTAMQQSTKPVLGRLKDSETTLESSLAQFGAFNLELDEAFDFARVPQAADDNESQIENSFKYEKAAHVGHRVESSLPIVFELCSYDNQFQKILSLAAVFKNLNIDSSTANCKHVLLHFNVNNDISWLGFKLFDLKYNTEVTNKVTNSYNDFKENASCKYIFVGNFRTFRGLEHSRITILIDRNIYSLQHYLVECIARCTTYLSVILLGNHSNLTSIIQKWREGIGGKPLIEIRQIILNKERKQLKNVDTRENERIIIDTFSHEYQTLQQTFNRPSFQNNIEEDLVFQQEAKIAVEM